MGKNLSSWSPENLSFWEDQGKIIARNNLIPSILALSAGFGIWMFWSIVTVQMLNLNFSFSKDELFNLSAIAGFTGATLRIPSSFLIRIAGGKNTIFFTTFLLLIPVIGAFFALQNTLTPLWVFQVLAFLSGIGGGNFASSMSNISFFYPRLQQGLALGLNAGLGNAGVTITQIIIPLAMTSILLGYLTGSPMTLNSPSGSILGGIEAGSKTWIQNSAAIWFILLIPILALTWFKMNNIETNDVTPNCPSLKEAILLILPMLLLGFFTSALGLYFILPKLSGPNLPDWAKWPLMVIIIWLTVTLLKLIPDPIRTTLKRQYKIFNNKHTWIMGTIYTMTFGSFIGFSAAFALCIQVIFGHQHIIGADGIFSHNLPNPNGPSPLMYAWLGPFVGALARPIGGKLGDKWGGAKITQIATILMIISSLGVAYYLKLSFTSPTPEVYFPSFFILFMVLFTTSGIGNGSVFRSVAIIFNREQTGPVLGWISALAAYGAFIIPKIFGEEIKASTPENALYSFAIFYIFCLILNWWFYQREKSEFVNP